LGIGGISTPVAEADLELFPCIFERLGYRLSAAENEVPALIVDGVRDLAWFHPYEPLIRILGLIRVLADGAGELAAVCGRSGIFGLSLGHFGKGLLRDGLAPCSEPLGKILRFLVNLSVELR